MKLLEVAAKIALGSDNENLHHNRQFLIGSLAERSDGAIVISHNITAQEPTPSAHAEARVLRKADAGCVLYVARVTRDGVWAMSKPCMNCQKLIRSRRVNKVYYTIAPGHYGVWKVKSDEWIEVKRTK